MSSNIKIENNQIHKNIEKSVCELLEKYHPSSNLLNMHPTHEHCDYYVASDPLYGLVMTNCFTNFDCISQMDINKVLNMKIHHSVLDYYNLNTEEEVANFFNKIFHF